MRIRFSKKQSDTRVARTPQIQNQKAALVFF